MSKESTDPLTQTPWSNLVTHDGVFAVDSSQRIVYWSDSARRILGYRSEEVVGRLCYETVPGRDSRNYRFCRRDCPVMVNARRGRSTPDYDVLCSLPDGREQWVNVTIVLPKGGRNSFQVLHIFRDVGRRRRIEEYARKTTAALHSILHESRGVTPEDGDIAPTPLPKLSRRELQVLRLLASGMTTVQIADALAVRPVTARNHVTRLLSKLEVENRLQAVVYASQRRLI